MVLINRVLGMICSSNTTDVFKNWNFKIFANNIERGSVVKRYTKVLTVVVVLLQIRIDTWAQSLGAQGMGYIIFTGNEGKGPIANALGNEKVNVFEKRI